MADKFTQAEGVTRLAFAVTPDELDEVRRPIRRRFGYVASFSHFPIVGLCEACAQATRA
jgi:hypothetical protein